ncbi:unnamed protein product [Cylicocyclus nassatus]|uniref:Uncharacterized protein n=1 Tax=Cylicocyclus nassatus TaxID=53992 RepID=A0AA36GF89_CYLNA|nr:unnamed protein product [Cylicocyclus nassatus]
MIYLAGTDAGAPPFWQDADRWTGFLTLNVVGLLVAPWVALAALVRHKDALARHQALAFALERSELERQALEARVQLLQRQVAPHFLFNTLANLQALVDSGSPQASGGDAPSGGLPARQRATALQQPVVRMEDEIALVSAYLELMHMRMPDRLRFRLDVAEQVRALGCPGLSVLTLVENAIRHGIDPCEDGGEVVVQVRPRRGVLRGLCGLTTAEACQLWRRAWAPACRHCASGCAAVWRCRVPAVAGGPRARRDRAPAVAGAGAARVIANALIADDEPLLRQALAAQLAQAWPQLQVVAQARNGREALQAFETLQPQVCFLDIHMPGLSGIDVAARIARRAQVVFVTAYDAYAVQAFAQGALDYLVKPVDAQRLHDLQKQLQQLAERLSLPAPTPLRWLHAQVGNVLRVGWRDDDGRPGEAVITLPLKELVQQLDPDSFVQVHRSAVVNRHAVEAAGAR